MNPEIKKRLYAAGFAALVHLFGSAVIAVIAALLVFGLWYPFPYSKFSGGTELFLLVITIDVIVGPVLTAVLFNPTKDRAELWRDLTIVAVLQVAALGYGLWSVWQARPLFMVAEVDRFKVITRAALKDGALTLLHDEMQPSFFSRPLIVAIRAPRDQNEKNIVLFESLNGGRDYGERPEFYLPYEGSAALKSIDRSRPLNNFLEKFPFQVPKALAIAEKSNIPLNSLRYLPVVARQDWIALLDEKGFVIGYLKGDGF